VFQEAKLLGPTERSIVVQTRKGTDLKNAIQPAPGFQQRQFYRALLQRYGTRWEERKPATGLYNCAGHVWASRRTALLDPTEWRMILDEDDYRRIRENETPSPGDLVLYIDKADDEILHVGRVLELRPGVAPEAIRIPWVLSKWDAKSGEVMHFAHDVPYGTQGIAFEIEYWTDRAV